MARAIIVGSPLFLDQNQRNASAFTSAIAISVSFAPKIGDLANADASAANNIGPLSAISARPPSPRGVRARASDARGRAEERRVGEECGSPCSTRWESAHTKKKQANRKR